MKFLKNYPKIALFVSVVILLCLVILIIANYRPILFFITFIGVITYFCTYD